MNTISDEILDDFLKTILTFEKFDNIFKKKLPRDLVRYIYDYVEPYCKECEKCCKICLYYCSLDCLRFENRDVCCRFELNEIIKRYEISENNTIEIEIIDKLESDDSLDI